MLRLSLARVGAQNCDGGVDVSRHRSTVHFQFVVLMLLLLACATVLTGCGMGKIDTSSSSTAVQGMSLQGRVHGGNQPVTGSVIQLYETGMTGYGSAPRPLVNCTGPVDGNGVATPPCAGVPTVSGGAFSISNTYACPDSDSLVYITATGGNPGLAAGTNNPSLVMMAALGSCSNLLANAATAFIDIDEVTTIASAYALAAFASPAAGGGINIGTPTSGARSSCQAGGAETCNYIGLANAFATVNNLVNTSTGQALTITPAYAPPVSTTVAYLNTSTVPTARINTLADILAPCVNSTGSDGMCGSLFSAATPPTGVPNANVAPVDTLQAALDIAQNPGHNVALLYGLTPSTPPFQPTLGLPAPGPNDWTLALTFTGAGLGTPPAVIQNGASTSLGSNFDVFQTEEMALAIDATGNVWVTGFVADYNVGISDAPLLAGFTSTGAPITPATTYDSTTSTMTFGGFIPDPTHTASNAGIGDNDGLSTIAIDQTGNLWVGDGENDGEIYEIANAATPSVLNGPITRGTGGTHDVKSMAIDSSGDIWAGTSDSLEEFDGTGNRVTLAGAIGGPQRQAYLLFDFNLNLWTYGPDDPAISSKPNVDQVSTSTGSTLFGAFTAASPASSASSIVSLVADSAGYVYGCADSSEHLDQFLGATSTTPGSWVNSANAPAIASGRACGDQLVMDGVGHLFAVSSNKNETVDEFTTAGALLSPASKGYTGTSSTESVTLNSNLNGYGGFASGNVIAAMDGSGNLWVINQGTGVTDNGGNALVEYVGIGAPVLTPVTTAMAYGELGVRP